MNLRVDIQGNDDLARDFAAAPDKIRRDWAEEAFAIGAKAVERIKREFRTTASPTSTAVRSGQLRRSYDHKVARQASETVLSVGAIRPTAGGQVPLHARVHEGFDHAGNKVASFVIKAKNAPYLHFPIRQGGGLGKGGIVGWARVKEVTLRPRPALEPVGQQIIEQLVARGAEVVTDAA